MVLGGSKGGFFFGGVSEVNGHNGLLDFKSGDKMVKLNVSIVHM